MADGFAMLEHDHRAVGEMFDDYEQGGDPALARQICFELTVHGEIEEQVLYPELREFGDKTSELSDHARRGTRRHRAHDRAHRARRARRRRRA